MIPFNPEGKIQLSMREIFEGANEARTKDEAKQYLKDYVAYIQENTSELAVYNNAEDIAKKNLGYWSGYYSENVRRYIEDLFECEHPVLGSIKEFGIPTTHEVFECGRRNITLRQLRKEEEV